MAKRRHVSWSIDPEDFENIEELLEKETPGEQRGVAGGGAGDAQDCLDFPAPGV